MCQKARLGRAGIPANEYTFSTPIAEELNLVPHSVGRNGSAETQDAVQLLANREPLLRRENHAVCSRPELTHCV
jgi:hypothetical protein